jgi:hypothetical protein
MSYYFTVCSTAMYQDIYIDFLLRHYEKLNLPYSFQVSLSYIASPIFMDKDCILLWDSKDEPVGALGFIYGTGEQDYKDKHIVQIQTFFLKEDFRSGRLFLQASQFFSQYLAQLNHAVTELRFWVPVQPSLQRLCAKIAKRTSVQETDCGLIEEYRIDFASWHAFVMKYPHDLYF